MTMQRPCYKLSPSKHGSDVAGEWAAALAAASIVFKDKGGMKIHLEVELGLVVCHGIYCLVISLDLVYQYICLYSRMAIWGHITPN